MKPTHFLAGAVLTLATPCHADWQYTHWGMTASEIVKASKGQAHVASEGPNIKCAFEGNRVMAAGRYRDFKVTFCGRDGRHLDSVKLSVLTETPSVVKRELLSTYGQPVSSGRLMTIWNDAKRHNTVTFMDIAGIAAEIEYKATGTARGL